MDPRNDTDPGNDMDTRSADRPPEEPDHGATAVLQDADRPESGAGADDALAQAEAKAAENWSSYLRAVAELENVRKRAQRDIENAHRFAVEKLAIELLPVKDSLELGVEAGANADARTLLAGKEATLKLLSRALERFNISEINPQGEPFDPQLHEAMATQESTTAEPDSVLQVVQKGYQLNGRLLRPARVIVARAPHGKS
jgi:molecular chaperone GrpE